MWFDQFRVLESGAFEIPEDNALGDEIRIQVRQSHRPVVLDLQSGALADNRRGQEYLFGHLVKVRGDNAWRVGLEREREFGQIGVAPLLGVLRWDGQSQELLHRLPAKGLHERSRRRQRRQGSGTDLGCSGQRIAPCRRP